jgi:nicotinate-nucleotide adenylyltransferase
MKAEPKQPCARYHQSMDLQPSGRPRAAFFGGSFDPPHWGHLAVAQAAQSALGLDTVLFAPVGSQPLKPQGSTAGFEDRLAMTRLAIAAYSDFALSLADAPKSSGAPNYTFESLLALRAQLPQDGALFCLMGADSFAGFRRWHRAAEIPFVAPLIVASRPGESLDNLQAALPDGLTIDSFSQPDLAVGQGFGPHIHPDESTRAFVPDAEIELRRGILRNLAGEQTPFYLLAGLAIEISASGIRDRIRDRIRVSESARTPSSVPVLESALLPAPVSEYIRAHNLYR